MRELGISYPVLVTRETLLTPEELIDPIIQGRSTTGFTTIPGGGMRGGSSADLPPGVYRVRRFDFIVHFCWQPKSALERAAAKKALCKTVPPPNREIARLAA